MASPSRDEKLQNLIQNHGLIFMGMFEEAFSDLAEKMTEVMSAGASAMASALGAPESSMKEIDKNLRGASPEVRAQISTAFSGLREEMEAQWPKDPALFKKFISGKEFDKGVQIVEKYDFKRPKLTEKLSDDLLASYIFLVKSGDAQVAKMFKELSDWQSGLPRPPWAGDR